MRPSLITVVFLILSGETLAGETLAAAPPDGAAIYAKQCASCHGEHGEGVPDEYDEPLWGDRSPESLARYIHKRMPEEDEEACVGEEAAAVARHIYDAFYSPEAQARNRPPRVELVRLTNEQYRQSVADLFARPGHDRHFPAERGLRGRYFNSEKMAKEKTQVLERVDPTVDFDFGTGSPAEGVAQEGFAIRWSGSLLVPETGEYDFRLRTPNGALLHLNHFHGGGTNGAFIDAYVSSGNEEREESGRMFLLGGRTYPLELRFFSYKEKTSSIRFEWKPPHGVWEVVPETALSPVGAQPVTVVDTPFPADDRSLGYERGSSVSKQWQEATTLAAITAANHAISHLERIAAIRPEDRKDAGKLRELCARVAERAFRRPLTGAQREFFVERRFAEAPDPETAVKHSLLLILTSPRFLYPGLGRNEGAPDSFTVASRLALALWDSLPDRRLTEAARRGALHSPAQIRKAATRMLDDPRARRKIRRFFHHWLALDEREDLRKNPDLFPEFDERLVSDLRRSLDHFLEGVVWSEDSDYRQLLVADYLHVNPRLARFYGLEPPDGGGFARRPAPDPRRAGVFTHPYVLAAFAYPENTSPIHRGVFLSRNVLGRLLKPPPQAIAFKDDEFDPTLTMREKVTRLTAEASCMACHAVINPVGFSLENYDAVGRFRTTDKNKPVDTVSDYLDDRERTVRLTGPRDLARLAIDSEAAHRAFLTHLFHHLVKQPVTAYGPDTLDEFRRGFLDSGYHIREAIVTMTVAAARHRPPEEATVRPAE